MKKEKKGRELFYAKRANWNFKVILNTVRSESVVVFFFCPCAKFSSDSKVRLDCRACLTPSFRCFLHLVFSKMVKIASVHLQRRVVRISPFSAGLW